MRGWEKELGSKINCFSCYFIPFREEIYETEGRGYFWKPLMFRLVGKLHLFQKKSIYFWGITFYACMCSKFQICILSLSYMQYVLCNLAHLLIIVSFFHVYVPLDRSDVQSTLMYSSPSKEGTWGCAPAYRLPGQVACSCAVKSFACLLRNKSNWVHWETLISKVI